MNLDRVAAYRIAPVEQAYTARDTMLYALGLGYGADPLDRSQLGFVYEQGTEPLKAVPSLSVVLAHPGFWVKDPALEIDWVRVLHGEQTFEIHRPLAPSGRVRGEYDILAVEDRGPDKGAVLHQSKRLYDAGTGELVATVRTVLMLRGDGGCGAFGTPPEQLGPMPDGPCDRAREIATLPQSALIYRLSGDYNPIHADPDAAARGGLERPILHGLCTMGIAVRAAIDALAEGRPERIGALSVRFSSPVYPGETIRTEFHGSGPDVRFRARVVERDVVVLDRGTITLI